MDLCGYKFNLLLDKPHATVCGWGSTEYDDHKYNFIGNAKFSENLHCMSITIRNDSICRKAVSGGDYRKKLMCGEATFGEQFPTLVITM